MTPERLAELKRLCDALPPGPWYANPHYPPEPHPESETPHQSRYVESKAGCVAETDRVPHVAEFIAAARTAVPELVAEVEHLTGLERQLAAVEADILADCRAAAERLGRPWDKAHWPHLTGATGPQCHAAEVISALIAEMERLQGVIAQHNLCHDLHGKVDAQAFADGCATEQQKLYGCAPDRDEVERLRAALEQCEVVMDTAAQHGLPQQLPSAYRDSWAAAHTEARAALEGK